jgi:hypothetical protein
MLKYNIILNVEFWLTVCVIDCYDFSVLSQYWEKYFKIVWYKFVSLKYYHPEKVYFFILKVDR